MRQSKRLRGCVVVILRAPQCDLRAEERPKRAPTAIRHSYTPRIYEPAAIGEPVKRHVRVTEYDRRLVSIGESVSIALDRRVDEHDLGIAPGAGVAEPHWPQPGYVHRDRQSKSASKFRCRESSRDAQYSVGGRAASGRSGLSLPSYAAINSRSALPRTQIACWRSSVSLSRVSAGMGPVAMSPLSTMRRHQRR